MALYLQCLSCTYKHVWGVQLPLMCLVQLFTNESVMLTILFVIQFQSA